MQQHSLCQKVVSMQLSLGRSIFIFWGGWISFPFSLGLPDVQLQQQQQPWWQRRRQDSGSWHVNWFAMCEVGNDKLLLTCVSRSPPQDTLSCSSWPTSPGLRWEKRWVDLRLIPLLHSRLSQYMPGSDVCRWAGGTSPCRVSAVGAHVRTSRCQTGPGNMFPQLFVILWNKGTKQLCSEFDLH